jgi:ParB family chromosome partitioning protein
LRAARLAGLQYIPALVRPADEIASLEIALAENVAREDLNAIEEALAYAALVDEFGLTHERIAELVGRSRVAVTNLLRLLDLPDEVQTMVERGDLSEGHGRALLALPDHVERRRVARLVAAEGLTVRQVEALVRKLNAAQPADKPEPETRPAAGPDFTELADELYGVFEAPVRIRSGKRGGSIQIGFKDAAELRRLVGLLRSLG